MAPKSVTFRRRDHLVSVLFGDLLSHSYNITFSMFLNLVLIQGLLQEFFGDSLYKLAIEELLSIQVVHCSVVWLELLSAYCTLNLKLRELGTDAGLFLRFQDLWVKYVHQLYPWRTVESLLLCSTHKSGRGSLLFCDVKKLTLYFTATSKTKMVAQFLMTP